VSSVGPSGERTGTVVGVRVLLIDAYPSDDPDRVVADRAAEALTAGGHEVDRLDLAASGFEPFMSATERAAYETDRPLVSDDTRAAAALVTRAEALLFCYPTTSFTVPALLKGWLERVMVLGVAFEFDDKGRVAPALTRVRRLGVLTTTPHSWLDTRRHRDGGRRTIMWTLRLNCHRFCRRTWSAFPIGSGSATGTRRRIERRLSRW
jgi:NAD(P)H dehydrogenase (quinone)